MAKIKIDAIKNVVKKGVDSIDVDAMKQKLSDTANVLSEKAEEAKDSAIALKEDIENKLTELDRMLSQSVTDYNDAYMQMNDRGTSLFVERIRSADSISFVENLINSIANKPKTFDADFEEIRVNKSKFKESCDFANKELLAAREAAGGAGAGLAAGASVAFMAPTAAMWIATTFGTASTGTAISALSGAAATNAALAWLGGGALATGGGGMVAGNAFLALAGPIGWSIAGASLLGSILIFSKKKSKINSEKNKEIETIKENTNRVLEIDSKIRLILENTESTRNALNELYMNVSSLYGKDYLSLSTEQKESLGSMVNVTKSLSKLLSENVTVEENENEQD